jgi:hypothetical protein
LAAAELSSPVV